MTWRWDLDMTPKELSDEVNRLRLVLEIIAEKSTDKLKAIQAKAALANVGPSSLSNGERDNG